MTESKPDKTHTTIAIFERPKESGKNRPIPNSVPPTQMSIAFKSRLAGDSKGAGVSRWMGDCDAACCVDFTTVASCLRSPIRVVSFCRNSIEGCSSDGVIERERHAGELIQAVSACAIDCCNSVQTRSFSFKRLRVSLSFLAGCRKVNNNFLLMFVEFLTVSYTHLTLPTT